MYIGRSASLPKYRIRLPLSRSYQSRNFSFSLANQHEHALRILFCGSDEFSIKSLETLHKHAQSRAGSIKSIDVVTKASKRTGRGLKKWTSPPIASIATRLGLPLHQIDTFTNWSPPVYDDPDEPNINLVIAVSFGLLIPARIINRSKYGGLNVHPSLLPELPGASPIQYAIIHGMRSTGISIQTLHPTRFDEGVVLAQQSVDIPRPDEITFTELRDYLAPIGANLLDKTLRERSYLQPHRYTLATTVSKTVIKAPRMPSAMKAVDFEKLDAPQIQRLSRALTGLWAEAQPTESATQHVRIILHALTVASHNLLGESQKAMDIPIGMPFAIVPNNVDLSTSDAAIYVRCRPTEEKPNEDSLLEIGSITVAGTRQARAAQCAWRARLFDEPIQLNFLTLYKFRAPLKVPSV